MSVDKYKITRLINRKPIEISKMQTIEKDGGIVMNYHETVITQIVEAQEKMEFECICAEIQKFIEENNIDICYVINKSELVDCLQEHQTLKLEIADLEAKLAEKENENKKLKQIVNGIDTLKQFDVDIEDYALVNKKIADKILCENQSKIDYAVEQLERARKRLEDLDDENIIHIRANDFFEIDEMLEKLITEIKERK